MILILSSVPMSSEDRWAHCQGQVLTCRCRSTRTRVHTQVFSHDGLKIATITVNRYSQYSSFIFMRDSGLNSLCGRNSSPTDESTHVFPDRQQLKGTFFHPGKEFHDEKSAVRNQLMFCLECFGFQNKLFRLSLKCAALTLQH